jgi:lysophospholipase L1-like esterase
VTRVTTPPETDPFSAARGVAIGAFLQGYADSPGMDPNMAMLATWNLYREGQRRDAEVEYLRDAAAAGRAELRTVLGIASKGTVKVLCLGDSITAGGVWSLDRNSYRTWFQDLLDQLRVAVAFSTWAGYGWKITDLQPGVGAALSSFGPDVVLLDIGSNDANQNALSGFQAAYGALVDQILASSPTVKVCCARVAISRGATLAANEATVNTDVDAVVAARASTGRVVSADMTVVPEQWTDNGIHPLDVGYALMAQQWMKALAAAGWLP